MFEFEGPDWEGWEGGSIRVSTNSFLTFRCLLIPWRKPPSSRTRTQCSLWRPTSRSTPRPRARFPARKTSPQSPLPMEKENPSPPTPSSPTTAPSSQSSESPGRPAILQPLQKLASEDSKTFATRALKQMAQGLLLQSRNPQAPSSTTSPTPDDEPIEKFDDFSPLKGGSDEGRAQLRRQAGQDSERRVPPHLL